MSRPLTSSASRHHAAIALAAAALATATVGADRVAPDRRRQPRPCGALKSSSGPIGTIPLGLIDR
jgi:hypothetical protein